MNQPFSNHRVLSDPALAAIRQIMACAHPQQRQTAISSLRDTAGAETPRVLLELWPFLTDVGSRRGILQSLGPELDPRTMVWLINFVGTTDHLELARQGVLALGRKVAPSVAAFLWNMAREDDHPLSKTAVQALASQPLAPLPDDWQRIADGTGSATKRAWTLVAASHHHAEVAADQAWDLLVKAQDTDERRPFYLLAISRCGTAQHLKDLQKLDASHHLLLGEQIQAARQRLSWRLNQNSEGLILNALTAASRQDQIDSVIALRGRAISETREALEKCRSEIPADLLATICIKLPEIIDAQEQQDLLDRLWEDLGVSIKALWVQSLVDSHKVPADEYLIRLGTDRHLEVAGYLHMPSSSWDDLTVEGDQHIALINAQVLSTLLDPEDRRQRLAKTWTDRLYKGKAPDNVEGRLIRAVAELGFSKKSYLSWLEDAIDQPNRTPSAYWALSRIQPGGAVLARHLQKPAAEGPATGLLRAAAEYHWPIDWPAFSNEVLSQGPQSYLLAVMSQNPVAHATTYLSQVELQTYTDTVLWLLACGQQPAAEYVPRVVNLLDHDPQLWGPPGLEALAKWGLSASAEGACRWLQRHDWPDQGLEIFLEHVQCRAGEDFSTVTQLLNSCPPREDERLTEVLAMRTRELGGTGGPAGNSSYDESLQRDLPDFDRYSSTVKTVLRNAALTWLNPELFTQHVDKSTMVIELTKSVDLMMQEKLGPKIFGTQRGDMLRRMQNTVVHLDLDGPCSSEELPFALNCGSHFSPRHFPGNKLRQICQGIVSGYLPRDQYRLIDGLRAWSVLLLLFGRNFSAGHQTIKPILGLRDHRDETIKGIAAEMNQLQHIRNQAAHRGTLLEEATLNQIRAQSINLIRKVTSILP